MILRTVATCIALFGVASAALPPTPINGDWRDVEIVAAHHQLRGDAGPDQPLSVGSLVYRGGLHLSSPDPAFGGFSGIEVSPDGSQLLAISDRGQWLEASLSYSDDGRLDRAFQGRMSAITDKDGVVLAGPIADAEGLARATDGRLIVSFERDARIDYYRRRDDGMIVFDMPLSTFGDGQNAPAYNKGIEAVAQVPSGVVALAENAFPSGAAGVFLRDGARHDLSYAPAKNFSVTDAEESGGTLFILERAFSKLLGVRSRILQGASPRDDGLIEATLLGSFGALYAIDNFEGIAIRESGGARFIYVISDDNHSARQKTLLLMFEVAD